MSRPPPSPDEPEPLLGTSSSSSSSSSRGDGANGSDAVNLNSNADDDVNSVDALFEDNSVDDLSTDFSDSEADSEASEYTVGDEEAMKIRYNFDGGGPPILKEGQHMIPGGTKKNPKVSSKTTQSDNLDELIESDNELSGEEEDDEEETGKPAKKKITNAERQQMRALKIKDGRQKGVPRVLIKLLLVQAGLGEFYKYFKRARCDVVDLYVQKTDVEVEFLLSCVESANNIVFAPLDRVRLYKLFRFRHFKAPANTKVFTNVSQIPPLMLHKNASRSADDAEIPFDQLDSDRQRQITRKGVFDEQSGMRIVQFEKYEMEEDIVYEIKVRAANN
jgi:hypothetical protein